MFPKPEQIGPLSGRPQSRATACHYQTGIFASSNRQGADGAWSAGIREQNFAALDACDLRPLLDAEASLGFYS